MDIGKGSQALLLSNQLGFYLNLVELFYLLEQIQFRLQIGYQMNLSCNYRACFYASQHLHTTLTTWIKLIKVFFMFTFMFNNLNIEITDPSSTNCLADVPQPHSLMWFCNEIKSYLKEMKIDSEIYLPLKS